MTPGSTHTRELDGHSCVANVSAYESRPKVIAFGPDKSLVVPKLRGVNVFTQTEMCRVMSKHGSDKGNGWHNYTTIYSSLFSELREEPLRIFELGLGTNKPNLASTMGANGRPGASLRGWREIFPNARVYGADIDRDILFEEKRIKTFYCDQRDSAAIRDLWSQPALKEAMDVIIDDGLHTFEGNASFLEGSLAHLRPGGVYVIEDILDETIERWQNQVIDVYSKQFPDYEFVLVCPPHAYNNHDNNLLVILKSGELGNWGKQSSNKPPSRPAKPLDESPNLPRKASDRSRVLIVSTMAGAPWGGSEELWSKAAGSLLERGCEVVVSKKTWPALPAALDLLAQAGAVLQFPTQQSIVERVVRKITGVVRRPYETSVLERHAPSIVLISLGNNTEGVEWMEACVPTDIPYVIVAQCAIPGHWPNDEHARALRTGYLRARKVYFVSKENIALTERQLGCILPNAALIRNPFKVPYEQEFSWPEEEPARWACVGRLDVVAKGQDLLFDVLAMEKWRSRPLRVTLYGRGRNEQILRGECERRRLTNVRFGGFADPVEIWSKEHCLILPSRYEGLPLAVVEAMLCGRPCIVTDVSGNKELLEDNVTGFVAVAPTVCALDEAMERAWERRGEWREIGERAAKSVRRDVPPDPGKVFADELLTLIGRQ